MAKNTGLFLRNGTFYIRFIVPKGQQHLFQGRSRIVKSLSTDSAREAKLQALVLRAQWLKPTERGYSPLCSCTTRTARSRISGEKRLDFLLFMAPSSQSKEPSRFPGRFKEAIFEDHSETLMRYCLAAPQ